MRVSAAHHRAWGSEWRPGVEEEAGHWDRLVCEAGIPAGGSGTGPRRPGGGSPELRTEAGGSSMRSVAAATTPGLQLLPRLLGLLLLLLLPLLCTPPLSLPVPTWVIQVRVTASPPLALSLQAAFPLRQEGGSMGA